MKRRIVLIFMACLFLLPGFAFADDFAVDFSSSTGFGISSQKIQINNINLDFSATNPLTGDLIVINSTIDVAWVWDQNGLCLRPDTYSDSNQGCRTASLSVNVTNALTGDPLSGATVTVGDRSAASDTTGVATLTNLADGSVQVGVSAPGFLAQTTTIDLNCDEPTSTGVSLIASDDQGVANGDIRIVLTWGENPEDLDSHLTGPQPGGTTDDTIISYFPGVTDGNGRFHIYYSNDNNCGDSESIPGISSPTACDPSIPAWLDVDDTTSFGPETITITKVNGQFIPGRYRYSVHHYSGSSNIPDSGAVVKVYSGSELLRTFYPPASTSGQAVAEDWVWTTFDLQLNDDGTISIMEVGTYNDPSDASDVGAFSAVKTYLGVPVQAEDPKLFMNLPSK